MTSALAPLASPAPGPYDRDFVRRKLGLQCSDPDLDYFLLQARRLDLDPILKQIYFIPRKGQYQVELGIGAYRLLADRTGEYAGQDEPIFEEFSTFDDSHKLPNGKEYPTCCRVTVYRLVQGVRCPFSGVAHWQDFYTPGNGKWNDMPYRMLATRAEQNALQKAFPAVFAGVYSQEEMDDATEREGSVVKLRQPQTNDTANHSTTEEAQAPQNGAQGQQEASATGAIGAMSAFKEAAEALGIPFGKMPLHDKQVWIAFLNGWDKPEKLSSLSESLWLNMGDVLSGFRHAYEAGTKDRQAILDVFEKAFGHRANSLQHITLLNWQAMTRLLLTGETP